MGFCFCISSCDEALSWNRGLSASLRGKEVDRGLDIAEGDLMDRGTCRKKAMMRFKYRYSQKPGRGLDTDTILTKR